MSLIQLSVSDAYYIIFVFQWQEFIPLSLSTHSLILAMIIYKHNKLEPNHYQCNASCKLHRNVQNI